LNSGNTNSITPILSIETSGNECGACLYFSSERFFQSSLRYKNVHAEKLFEVIDSVLKAAGLNISDLKGIAVSNGPGSFTGLRIGMSAAKGIAYGISTGIIPVPTFEALALQITKFLPENSIFAIANKVNIDEVYFAKFQIKSNNYIFVENIKILSYKELISSSDNILIFGNALKNKENGYLYKTDLFAPEPRYVAEWAIVNGKKKIIKEIDYIEPNYLKNFTIKVHKND
jgi:tRNA threonylcarbamoyladenosine biosynthesis protein TsaB